MERSEISVHEMRVYTALREAKKWLTAKEVAAVARVADRTARAHLFKLASLGIVDTAEIFPSHRYRLSQHASKRNAAYVSRLQRAIDIIGGDDAEAH